MFNYIFKFHHCLGFRVRRGGGVRVCHVRCTPFIFSVLAVISIISYCSIEFGFAFNEIPKLSTGSFYNWNRLLEFGEQVFVPPGTGNGVDAFKGGENFVSENGAGSIKGSLLLDIKRETVAKPSYSKSATCTEQPKIGISKIDPEYYHFLLSLIPMWLAVLFWSLFMIFIPT